MNAIQEVILDLSKDSMKYQLDGYFKDRTFSMDDAQAIYSERITKTFNYLVSQFESNTSGNLDFEKLGK